MIKSIAFIFAVVFSTHAANCQEPQPFMRAIYERQLADCESALSKNPAHVGVSRYGPAARAAFELGEYEKARFYATQGLEAFSTLTPRMARHLGGESVFYGHLVLGRLALMTGDVAVARQELVLAGKSHGSPVLDSFGPSMRLAFDLLARPGSNQEDRLAVVGFLRGCEVFWPEEHIDSWVSAIEVGEIPKFPPSLLF